MQPCDRCGKPHESTTKRGVKPTCVGHSRSGNPCRQFPINGGTVCRMHGGGSPATKRKAKERLAAAKLESSFKRGPIAKLLAECDIPNQNPLDGLLEVIRHTGAMMRLLAGWVGELDKDVTRVEVTARDEETGEPIQVQTPTSFIGWDHLGDQAANILVTMYGQWADRHARACKLALDAGIDERLVRNAEATSERMFRAFDEALQAAQLDAVQAGNFRAAFAESLRRHAGPEPVALTAGR